MPNYRTDNKLEKYYTDEDLINFVVEEWGKWVDFSRVVEFLEPAAGSGNMIYYLKRRFKVPVISYDIFNETGREDIIEANFLNEKIEYKSGRFTLSNPPFSKGIRFLKRIMKVSDSIAIILSSSSIVNIDWDWVQEEFEVHKIQLKKHRFEEGMMRISIIYMTRKKFLNNEI